MEKSNVSETFNIKEFADSRITPIIRKALARLEQLGIENADYISLPSNKDSHHAYVGVPPEEFPWQEPTLEVWGFNLWKREANARLNYPAVHVSTDLRFDDLPEVGRKLSKETLLMIREKIAEYIQSKLEGYADPEERAWEEQHPRIKRLANDVTILTALIKLK